MKPKSHTLTHWLEIPIRIHFTVNPEERQTLTYPGCPAHIEIDEFNIPTQDEIQKLMPDDDRLAEICMEDLED